MSLGKLKRMSNVAHKLTGIINIRSQIGQSKGVRIARTLWAKARIIQSASFFIEMGTPPSARLQSPLSEPANKVTSLSPAPHCAARSG